MSVAFVKIGELVDINPRVPKELAADIRAHLLPPAPSRHCWGLTPE